MCLPFASVALLGASGSEQSAGAAAAEQRAGQGGPRIPSGVMGVFLKGVGFLLISRETPHHSPGACLSLFGGRESGERGK